MTRTVFAILLIVFPVAVAIRIRTQRRAIGRSPVIMGAAARNAWEAWFERLGPAGLGFWPAAWLWIALGGAPIADSPPLRYCGLALVVAGAVMSLSSVFLMGRTWRIGIDPENKTDLTVDGPFRWVRHPIYAGWLLMLVGTVLVVAHPLVDIAALVTALGVAYQAAREERHLLGTFGERYARYAARTGRFAPRLRRPRGS